MHITSSLSRSITYAIGKSGATEVTGKATPAWKLRAGTVAILAGLTYLSSGGALATEATPTLGELQAENARLRAELEALKKTGASAAAPATAATQSAGGVTAVISGSGGYDPNAGVTALDKVVVTSRNREEIAQDVPLPVVVLGGERLSREDIKSVWDLPKKVPNLQMNNPGENARKVSPSIRGLGRSGANDSMEQSVGIIVDGVTLYYSGQAWSDYVDLDRIEVLNGPQGTLMGKNTSVGAINIVTKAPSFTRASSYEIGTGDLNSLNGKFSSTGPLVDGKLAYRGSFVVDRGDGIFTNVDQSLGHSKETLRETNRIAGRLQFLWTPSDDLSGRFIFDKLRSNELTNTGSVLYNGSNRYANGTLRPTYTPYTTAGTITPTGSYTNFGYSGYFARRSAWFHNADGTIYQPKLGTTDQYNSETHPQITNQYGASGQFDWRVADHTLTSITAYRYQDFDIKNGGNYGQFYISNSGQQLWNRQVSQEFRLASTPGPNKPLDYQVGLYYLNAEVYSDDPTYYGPDAGAWNASDSQYQRLVTNAAGRELLRVSLDGLYKSSVTDAKVRSLAGYGQADWHVDDRATLTFGLRRTSETKDNKIATQLDRAGANLSALAATNGASAAQLADAQAIRSKYGTTPMNWVAGNQINATLTAWNFGPSYKLNDDVLLYSSVGQGVKSGFIYFSQYAVPSATDFETDIRPEKTLDFELGAKSLLLDRKLQLNANLYATRIKDYQASWTRLDPNTGLNISGWGNAPKVKARGLELQSIYQYDNQLNFDLAAAFNKSTYEAQWLVQAPEIATTQYFDAKGNQIANVPKVIVNYGANYQAPVGGYLGRLTVSNSYRSEVYLNDNRADFARQPAYTVTDLGIGLGGLDRKWEISLLGKNILNTKYNISASTFSSSVTSSQSLIPGAYRNWQLWFKAKI